MAEDYKDTLLKAASLCREASAQLKLKNTPEKRASEVVNTMVTKGLIQDYEKDRYSTYLSENPEKIASFSESFTAMPARMGAIGEVSNYTDKTASDNDGADAMDKFMFG